MNNKLVTVISFASIFVILAATISIWTLNANAQEETSKINSSLGTKITSIVNSSLIITPWNTGNDKNNVSASNND
jgi:hypothetical protein